MNQYTPTTEHALARLHQPRIASRRIASDGWKASRRWARKFHHEKSMMHAGHPTGHRPVGITDERTAQLFAAHERRKAAGWIRG